MDSLNLNEYVIRRIKHIFDTYNQIKANESSYARAQPNDNVELEIIFRNIDREMFLCVYDEIKKSDDFDKPMLHCDIRILDWQKSKKFNITDIKNLKVKDGEVVSEHYYRKTRLKKDALIRDTVDHSIKIAIESPRNSVKFIKNNLLLRFKARISANLFALNKSKWRFDMSIVKSANLQELGNNLSDAKHKMFPVGLSVDNFDKEFDFSQPDLKYEIEIEYIGEEPITIEDYNVVKKLYSIVKPSYIDDVKKKKEVYYVASHIYDEEYRKMFKKLPYGIKKLGNQARGLDKYDYRKLVMPLDTFYITEKADGQRAIISIHDDTCRILLNKEMIEHKIKQTNKVCIVDCELIDIPKKPIILIFDVIAYDALNNLNNNTNIAQLNFKERLNYFSHAQQFVQKYLPHYDVRKKNYVEKSSNLEKAFKSVYEAQYPYKIDGVIITTAHESYGCTNNYKWKPMEDNTIDFVAMKCPSKMLGIEPYNVVSGETLYLLFVGINNDMRIKLGLGFISHYDEIFESNTIKNNYYPVQFSPSANPLAFLFSCKDDSLDKQIVELTISKEKIESLNAKVNWKLVRVRKDRTLNSGYFGNDFKVAELTFNNFIDNFNFEDLWKPYSVYFRKNAGTMYELPNKYKRIKIDNIIKQCLSNKKWVIDLASGRGADLHRYIKHNVKNVVCIDNDKTAIIELIHRKFDYYNRNRMAQKKQITKKTYRGAYEFNDVQATTIHTLVADLKQSSAFLVSKMIQFGLRENNTDGIICNFAFHYLCESMESLRNILIFVRRMLKTNDVFIFTVMDGKQVFDLLSKNPKFVSYENNVLKYAIHKKYKSDKIAKTGQMISVKLPFTDEMYDEPLCNIDAVIKEAKKLNLVLVANESLYNEKFHKNFIKYSAKDLTDEDIKYIKLHHYVILRKK